MNVLQISDRVKELAERSGYPDNSVGMLLSSLVCGNRSQTILEVGYNLGYSALWLCEGTRLCSQLKTSKVVSVDIAKCDGGAVVQSFGYPNHTFLQGHSHQLRPNVISALGHQIDFLFLDGDHTYAGLKGDWETYGPMLSDKGLAVFHDVYAEDMKRVLDELDPEWNVVYLGGWACLSVIRKDKYHNEAKHGNMSINSSQDQ